MKRTFDLFVSSIALLVLSPLFVALLVTSRLKLGSPVFFRQARPGLNCKPFKLVKFRTMTFDLDEAGALLPDSERLSGYGKFLRSSSLDEFPELWNVLKGEMSLVGPRPLLVEYLDLYSAEQLRRHEVRPGITGWAQVNGRNALGWEEKFALDVWYVDNRSMLLDIKILLMTVVKVLQGEGISQDGHATMQPFTGSPE